MAQRLSRWGVWLMVVAVLAGGLLCDFGLACLFAVTQRMSWPAERMIITLDDGEQSWLVLRHGGAGWTSYNFSALEPVRGARPAVPSEFALPRWAAWQSSDAPVAPVRRPVVRQGTPSAGPYRSATGFGWPLRSWISRTAYMDGAFTVESGLRVQTRAREVILPTSPSLPGMVANAIFNGTALGLLGLALLQTWRAVRARLRGGKGRCKRCGYDLRGCASAQCPECGDVQ